METQYWLADYQNINQYGWSMDLRLVDGPHSNPEGVSKAQKIISGIGLDRGKKRNYVMITIQTIPDEPVKLNQEAIKQCKSMVDFAQKIKK